MKKKKYFYVLNRYESVTHVSISIFQGLFRNIVLGSAVLVTEKLWAIIDFFSKDRTFFRAVPNPMHSKNFTKHPLN